MQSFASNMLQSLKPFLCPTCNFSFTSRDGSRVHNVSRFPLILKCCHTVCENCLKASLKVQNKVICTICQACTEFEDKDISRLLPDVYVLGIVNANLKQSLPSLKMKLTPATKNGMTNKDLKKATVTCDHCCEKEAFLRCEKCEENFCNGCFDSFHKNRGKNLKKHIGVPVYSQLYNSIVQSGCPEHDNRSIEFVCEEDNELVCSLCVVTGAHKGHAVLTLVEKNKTCAKDLEKVREDAHVINKRLKLTEQKLAHAIPNEKVDNSQWIKEIHDHFHNLHSALIMRENEMISQLESISESSVSILEKLREEVSCAYRDLDAVLHDAELAIENPTLSVSVPTIIKKLESIKAQPCHLVPVSYTGDDNKLVSLDFSDDLEELIMKHGSIIADIKPKFCLKTDDELPEDFIVEPLPPDSPATDAESVVSDSFSEDSLSSLPANIPNLPVPLKMTFMNSKQELVHVTHISDPTYFYVVKSSELRKLKLLQDKITSWCRSPVADRHTLTQIKEGDLYLVRYSADKKWYRGRATRLIYPDEDSEEMDSRPDDEKGAGDSQQSLETEILYIDFGNTEIVPANRMRKMQSQFLNLPGMARLCCLHGIVPIDEPHWTREASTTFKSFVNDKAVNMHIIEERAGVLYVDLSQAAASDIANDTPVSVRDALVFLEHGCLIPQARSRAKRGKQMRQFFPPEELRANTRATVLVSHVESPSLFYVQQLSSSRHLSDLLFAMNNAYSDTENPSHAIYVPYIGMMCAAQFRKDKFWYRAEVIGLPGKAKVEVQYIDFGNKAVVHHKYLRKLLDNFARLTTQAVACNLVDVMYSDGTGWSKEATSWFTNYVEKKHLNLLSLGIGSGAKTTKAVVFDPQDDMDVCVNALMAGTDFAISTGPHSKIINVPHIAKKSIKSPKAVTDPPKIFEAVPQPPNEVISMPVVSESLKPKKEPPNHVKVHVSYIESPGHFFVRIANDVEKNFKSLMQTLEDVYNDLEGTPASINVGSSYAVFRQSERRWYRGIALEEATDDTYSVRFVDVGFVEDVRLKHFRVLLKQHSTDQAYAIECHLASILPAGDSSKWPQLAISTFKELVDPHDILCLTGEEQLEGNSLPVDLVYQEVIRGGALEPSRIDFCSVRERLIEEGVALRIRKKKVVEEKERCSSPAGSIASTICDSPNTCKSVSPVKIKDTPELVEHVPTMVSIKKVTLRSPTFQWRDADIPKKTKFLCHPTHVADDGSIFIQLKPEGTSKVELITNSLSCKYANAQIEKLRIPPAIGEAVLARFTLDKKLYRAELLSDDPSKIKVQFVDYGNCEIVNLDDMYLDPPFKETPRLSFQCELHDIKPISGKVFSPNILNFIHENVVEQECMAEVMVLPEGEHQMQISLVLQNTGTNISDLLKELEFASSEEEYEERLTREITSISSQDYSKSDVGRFRKATDLKVGEPFIVCITQLLEANIVCLQRLKNKDAASEEDVATNSEIDRFLEMIANLNKKAETFPGISDPKIGMACCAKYSYDNNWYRCEITSIDSNGIRVYYVDYGNAEILPLNMLRLPDQCFLDFPIQAHVCKIQGLQQAIDEWSSEEKEVFTRKLIQSDAVYAKVDITSEISEIELLTKKDDGSFELIYKDIVKQ